MWQCAAIMKLKQISLQQSLKLFVVDVCLLKTSWKTVPQPRAGSLKTLVRKVAVGPQLQTV